MEGCRTDNPRALDETDEVMRDRGGMAWIGLYRPEPAELRSVAEEFSLHELAVEDAQHGHQRSKLERYGDTLFTVLRPARYLDDVEKVGFGELHVFVGDGPQVFKSTQAARQICFFEQGTSCRARR